MRSCRGRFVAATVVLAVSVILVGPAGGPAAAGAPASCRDYRVPMSGLVTESMVTKSTRKQRPEGWARRSTFGPISDVAGTYHIAGTLCLPRGGREGQARGESTVQLLIPGATYDRKYWDFPVPGYSYARYAAAHGQATFNIDRFNTGRSSHLPPALVTIDLDAAAVHQVIRALRAGEVGGVRFSKVVTVGHSLGSMVAVQEAATYQDVDGVILSAFTNYPGVQLLTSLGTLQLLVPAPNEPLGELTTPPGGRKRYFHAKGNIDPAVLAKDEATKDTVTVSEMLTTSVPILTLPTHLITAPVLLASGQKDVLFVCVTRPCEDAAMLRRTEAPRFTAVASLDAFVLPRAGHSINLARNHEKFFQAATAWVRRNVA